MCHPDALRQQSIRDRVRPSGQAVLEPKIAQQLEATGRQRAIGELVAGKTETTALILHERIGLRDHDDSLDRRPQRGHEQSVVTARVGLCDGAGGEPSEPVRDEPFPLERVAGVREIRSGQRGAHGPTPGTSSGMRYRLLRAHR